MKKIKQILLAGLMLLSTFAGNVIYAEDVQLNPGEVYTNSYAKWASKKDAEAGIAQINIELYGKNKLQATDVAYVVDFSDSMLYQKDASKPSAYQGTPWKQVRDASSIFFNKMLSGEENKENQVALVPFAGNIYDESYANEASNFWSRHEWLYCNNETQSTKGSCKIGEVNTIAMKEFFGFKTYDENDVVNKYGKDILSKYGYTLEDIKPKTVNSSLTSLTKDVKQLEDNLLSVYPSGGTNYTKAMEQAETYLQEDNGHRKVVVLISDGEPNAIDESIEKANELKKQGIEFYTIGTNVNDNARDILKTISTDKNGNVHYGDADTETLSDIIASLSGEINQAGTEAKIQDYINSDAFAYYTDDTHKPAVNGSSVSDAEFAYDDNSKSVTWNVGDIVENKKVLTYYVKLNKGLETTDNLYPTSTNIELNYKDPASSDQTKNLNIPEIKTKTGVIEKNHYLVDEKGNYIDRFGNATTKENALLKTEVLTNQPIGKDINVNTEETFEFEGKTYHGNLNPQNVKLSWGEDDQAPEAKVDFTCTLPLQATFMVDDSVIDTTSTVLGSAHKGTVKVPEKEGYQFAGWFSEKDGQGTAFDVNTIATGNAVYYANFTPKSYAYSIQYYYDGTKLDEVNGLQAEFGSTITSYENRDGNGKYTLVNVPSVVIGTDATANVMKVMYETKKFSVTFIDKDGNTLSNQNIAYGKDATAPTAPELDGYVFQGWDKAFNNVTSDLIVQAVYEELPEPASYLVTFVGMNGEVLSTQQVKQGTDATAPNSPNVEGYDFISWDKEFTNVQGNLIVNAQYQIKSFDVVFTDRDGNEIAREEVVYGNDATAPTAPTVDGYTFSGWNQEFTNIKEDKVIQAIYTENVVVTAPSITPTPQHPTTPTTQPEVVNNNVTTQPVVVNNNVTTTPENVQQEIVPVQKTPKAQGEKEVVKKNVTPQAAGQGYWALFNLLFAAATLVLAIFLLFNKLNKEEEDEEDDEQSIPYQRKKWMRIVTSVVAIAAVIVFALTEDITLAMRYIDSWTLLMAVIFVAQVVFFFYARKWKEVEEEEETQNN